MESHSLFCLFVCLFVCLYQQTPLHTAAAKGHDNTVLCLIKNGADKSITDKQGVSVFDYIPDGKLVLLFVLS